jgi:hypothetical protein
MPGESSLALALVVPPFALVEVAAGKDHFSVSVTIAVLPLALISVSVIEKVNSVSVAFAFFIEVALVISVAVFLAHGCTSFVLFAVIIA